MTDELPRYRTLFISDVHLGARGCQAEMLLDFLREADADAIFLVGDIVDGWSLSKTWYWPQTHNDVVQKLLRKVRKGAQLLYVPGNHDEFLRDFYGLHVGGVEVVEDAIHAGADGRRYLIIHGDIFDVVVCNAKWLAYFGDWAYETALKIGAAVSSIRRKLGLPYWSLSAWAKLKVKTAVNFIGNFEKALVEEARRRGVDGVVCGHIHHAAVRDIGGIAYINCGDWVESCTAIAETFDGRFEIIRWADVVAARPRPKLEADEPAPLAA